MRKPSPPRAGHDGDAHHRLMELVTGADVADDSLVSAAERAWIEYRDLEGQRDRLAQRGIEMSLALDSAQVGTWIWRSLGSEPELESQVNIAPMLGLDVWDGTWTSFLERVVEEDREMVRRAFAGGLEGEVEFQVVHGAERRWLRARGQPLPGERRPLFVAGTLEDVTERRVMQEQLRDAEAKYHALVEQLPAIVYIVKLDRHGRGRTTYISPQVESILGYTPQEWLADRHLWWKIVEPEWRDRIRAEIGVKDTDPASPQRISQEYPVRARDGRRVWLRNESVTEWGADGRTRYTDGVLLDITASRARQERLDVFGAVLGSWPHALWVTDAGGRLQYVNEAALRRHGWDELSEVLGQPASVLGEVPGGSSGPAGAEIERRRRDGTVFRAHVTAREIVDEQGRRLTVWTL